jgi:hypothetical protein
LLWFADITYDRIEINEENLAMYIHTLDTTTLLFVVVAVGVFTTGENIVRRRQ